MLISKADQVALDRAFLLGFYRGVLESIAGGVGDPRRLAQEAPDTPPIRIPEYTGED